MHWRCRGGPCLGLEGGGWQGAERCPSLPAVLEVCQFSRDASVAESWLMAQEPYLASSDYGQTVDAVEKLLKRHEAFEKSSATWEERIAALRKLTTVRKARDGAQLVLARLCLPCLSFPTPHPHQPLTSSLPSPAAGAPGRADAARGAGTGRGDACRGSRLPPGSGRGAGGWVRDAGTIPRQLWQHLGQGQLVAPTWHMGIFSSIPLLKAFRAFFF